MLGNLHHLHYTTYLQHLNKTNQVIQINKAILIIMKIFKSLKILFLLVASSQQPEITKANEDLVSYTESGPSMLASESRIDFLESRLKILSDEIDKLKKALRCLNNQTEQTGEAEQTLVTSPSGKTDQRGDQRSASLERRSLMDDKRQANFLRGEPGRNGLDGVPGLDGAPGLDGVPGADGRDGKDGINGHDGKDGRDGLPGERGPVGPPGPPGEIGRRGKQGLPGKTGAPGLPGVCVYKAKYDCSGSSAPSGSNQTLTNSNGKPEDVQTLLMAPTIIGYEHSESGFEIERQVTVKEGDYIQLSCEAVGSPRPSYAWRRLDKSSAILLDPAKDLRVTSFFGSQLPFVNVDRLQTGSYECIASNGIPPAAVKKINLVVNYAPTIRLYPAPSVYRVPFGSSILIECIVDASPSSFSYWMFGSDLIMSIAPPSQTRQSDMAAELSQPMNKLNKKYTVTESTGQLSNGAYYSILTLDVSNISRGDLGLYKCISKNLIGQTTGYAWIESQDDSLAIGLSNSRYRQTILERSSIHERLDHMVGWPNYLTERESNYSTFGNEHRQQVLNSSSLRRSELSNVINGLGHTASLHESTILFNSNESAPTVTSSPMPRPPLNANRKDKSQIGGPIMNSNINKQPEASSQHPDNENESNQLSNSVDDGDEIELCRVENADQHKTHKLSTLLLDQVGKPVYVGSVAGSSLNWWSLDTKPTEAISPISNYYATFSNISDQLFEYDQLSELLKGQTQFDQLKSEIRRLYKLRYPMAGNSRTIYGKVFLYATIIPSRSGGLSDYRIIAHNLITDKDTYLPMDDKILRDINAQPFDLADYKMDRIEFVSDENGLWLIFPTIEPKFDAPSNQNRLLRAKNTRRLHALKLRLVTTGQDGAIEVDYHVSMKLDWQMIGQMFIIDGVLYGIKDRHLYLSKLQFAYDLYRCKLLSTEYLIEPHRAFNNHFGNSQMIKYNPNEPKRLYTIDNGNLLWCPVKLTMVNQTEI